MKNLIITLCALGVIMAAMPQSHATSSRLAALIKGHPSCKKIARDDIRSANDRASKGSNIAKGKDGQQIEYKVQSNRKRITSWRIIDGGDDGVLPINFVIVKGTMTAHGRPNKDDDYDWKGKSRDRYEYGNYSNDDDDSDRNKRERKKKPKKEVRVAKVFHYGSSGARKGGNLRFAGKIKSVSFCYEPDSTPPPPPPSPPVDLVNLGPCEELDDNKLANTRIGCPTGSQRAILSLSLEDKQDFAVQFCTCGTDFAACNPNLNMGDLPDTDGEFEGLEACTGNQGVNTRVPLGIMGVENPASYVCFTSGGTRVCYGHFETGTPLPPVPPPPPVP